MKWFVLSVTFIFLFTGQNIRSQNIRKFIGSSEFSTKISFNEIEAWDKVHPVSTFKPKVPNKEPFIYPEFPVEGKPILYRDKSVWKGSQANLTKDPSPLPDKDFQALTDNNTSIPPDVNGAPGLNHLMVTLNTEYRIMDKEGNIISTVSPGAFWHSVPGAGGVFDPKINYDSYSNRWIFIMPSESNPALSKLMVAVSENSDPTGNWFLYVFDGDPDDTHWFDYPNVGFNKNWIVVSGNMFGDGFGYSALYVFEKQDLYDHLQVIDYTRFSVYDGFTLIPAVTFDTEEEDVYIVSNAGGNVNGSGWLSLRKVTGGLGNETVEDIGLIEIADPWGNGSYANGGNFAPQLGSDEKINTVDARMENMVYRHGKLWCTHHIYLPAENPTRCSVQWFELATDGTILQRGRVDDANGNRCYAFATIAVNANEDIMVGYGSFSPEQYASGSYSFRYASDPPNILRDSYQFIDGLAPYFKTYGGDRNRWGDYTATMIDPADDLDFWTIQQYADLPASQDRWATWWAMVNIDAKPEAAFEANITTVPTGSTVNFTDLSRFEPTEWYWTFEAGVPHNSTEQNPQNILYSFSGYYDVTLIASNYLGSDTLYIENYINSSTTILPEVSYSVDNPVPCTGDTIRFTDSTIYNPVEWLWGFYPDSVTFVNGTSVHSRNPEIIAGLPMPYNVTLTASNINGSTTVTKTSMVIPGGYFLPYSEDFETTALSDRYWQTVNPDSSKTWELVMVEGNDPGEKAAYVNIKNYIGLSQRDQLVSPLINLTDYREATLEFQYAYAQRFPQYTDSLIVYLAYDCGSQFVRLLSLGQDSLMNFATADPTTNNFIPQSENDWCGSEGNPACPVLDLTPWKGYPDLRIVFESYNGFGNNLFIDNVSIEGTLSGTGETAVIPDEIHIYPNPTEGSFTVKTKDYAGPLNILITDMTGRFIQCQDYPGGINKAVKFDISGKGKGIYLIEIATSNKSWIRKLIVK
jgi:PKD repeat protein